MYTIHLMLIIIAFKHGVFLSVYFEIFVYFNMYILVFTKFPHKIPNANCMGYGKLFGQIWDI
jgi:hypothetical protein